MAAGSAGAASLTATPSLSLDERYDSNVFNASTGEKSDFVSRATPKLTLSLATLETTVNLSGSLELEKYSKYDELENNPATKSLDLSASDLLKITPRFRLRPSARFIETQDSLRRNALTQDSISGLAASDTTVNARTGVREFSGSMQMTVLLTSNVDLGIGGGGTRREFTDNTTGLYDSRSYTGNASVAWRVTPRFSSGLFFDTSYNAFDGRPNSRTYAAGLTGNYQVTEHYVIDGRAGPSFMRESTGAGDEKIDTWSPYGRLSVKYMGESFRATLQGSYEFAGSGSTGSTTKRGNVSFGISDSFSPKWSWNLSASWQSNVSTDTPRTDDSNTVGGSAGLKYQAAEWASVRLSGNAFRQRNRGTSAVTDIDRNSVLLGFDLSAPYKIF